MEYCPKERERERKQNKTKSKQLHRDKEKDECLKSALYQGAILCLSVTYFSWKRNLNSRLNFN